MSTQALLSLTTETRAALHVRDLVTTRIEQIRKRFELDRLNDTISPASLRDELRDLEMVWEDLTQALIRAQGLRPTRKARI